MFNFFRTMTRYKTVAEVAFEEEKQQGRKNTLDRNEREFQAAAIEILETPPSPVGRMVGLMIILLISASMVWSIFGKFDIYATMQGRIVPMGNVKVIEPIFTSKVRMIHVRPGQDVKKGDILLELEPAEKKLDRSRLAEDLVISRAISARLAAAVDAISKGRRSLSAKLPKLQDTPDDVIDLQQKVLIRTVKAYEAEQARIEGEIQQKTMEMQRTKNTVLERNKLVEVMTERVNMLDNLAKSGSGSRASYLERAQLLYEQRADLATEKGRLAELASAIATLKLKGKQRREETLHKLATDLSDNEKRIAGLRKNIYKVQNWDNQSKIYAPVDGVIQQLGVHSIGDVLTAGQQAMVIVPKGTKMEIQAGLLNRDKGFVKASQDVRIKVETFNYAQYGTIPGKVLSISDEATSLARLNNLTTGSTTKNREIVFPVRIALKRETIPVNGKNVKLSPGMSVTAEVKTGDRRVIEFLLGPLLKLKDESFRER